MTLHWADLAWVVGIVVAGGGVSYLLLLRRLRRTLAEHHREMERRLAALTEAIQVRTATAMELATDALAPDEIEASGAAPAEPARVEVDVPGADLSQSAVQEQEQIPPGIQVAIAAAAIAALGNHARVRSARQIPSSDIVSPWTQQGRVIVQSSHNLRTQGTR